MLTIGNNISGSNISGNNISGSSISGSDGGTGRQHLAVPKANGHKRSNSFRCARSNTVRVNGVNLYYEERGNPDSEEAVVFLNGIIASTQSWELQVPVFELSGHRVILHDYRGQLRSEKPEGCYSFLQHARDLRDLLAYLGQYRPVHLVGISYGGMVALRFALDYPEQVKSLSILNSFSEKDDQMVEHIRQSQRFMNEATPYDYYNGIIPLLYGDEYIEENFVLLEEQAQSFRLLSESFFRGQNSLFESLLECESVTDELDKIDIPTFVISGDEDKLNPPRLSQIISRQIVNSKYVNIPGCGHVSITEKPGVINSLVFGFINGSGSLQ